MRTWLRLRIEARAGAKANRALVEVVALANSGYGALRPQVSLPIAWAEALGLWPDLPPGTRTRTYRSAGGEFKAHVIPEAADVSVAASDRVQGPVLCEVQVNALKSYAIMNVHLLSLLRIVLLDPAKGTWAFADELGKPRPSEPEPQA